LKGRVEVEKNYNEPTKLIKQHSSVKITILVVSFHRPVIYLFFRQKDQ